MLFDFNSKKELEHLRHKVSHTCGGIRKRVDENRELLETLLTHAPDVLQYMPWIERAIRSQDEFLTELLEAVESKDERQYRMLINFPRPMPSPLLLRNDERNEQIEQDKHAPLASGF